MFYTSVTRAVFGFVILICLQNLSHSYPLSPHPIETPGHLCQTADLDFIEYRYAEAIPYCKRKVSTSKKRRIYEFYGIPEECRHRYTIDHMIPLAIGGSNHEQNLWPEHVLVKATRPALETQLYWALRKGTLTQDEALDIVIRAKTEALILFKNHDFQAHCDLPTP